MYFQALIEAEIENDQLSDPVFISDHHIRMHQLTILHTFLQTRVKILTDMHRSP